MANIPWFTRFYICQVVHSVPFFHHFSRVDTPSLKLTSSPKKPGLGRPSFPRESRSIPESPRKLTPWPPAIHVQIQTASLENLYAPKTGGEKWWFTMVESVKYHLKQKSKSKKRTLIWIDNISYTLETNQNILLQPNSRGTFWVNDDLNQLLFETVGCFWSLLVPRQVRTCIQTKKLRFKSFSSSRGPRLGHRTGSSMMPKVQAPEMACRKSEAVELAKGYIPPLDTLPTAFSHIHPNFRSARSTSTSCNSALECPHALFSPSKSSLPVESGRTSTFRVLHPLAKYMSSSLQLQVLLGYPGCPSYLLP